MQFQSTEETKMRTFTRLLDLLGTLALSSTVILISTLTLSEPAHAWFQMCNRSSATVRSAFAYFDDSDNRSQRAGNRHWVSEGWWTLEPGRCVQAYPHELWRRNRYYYIYAEEVRGNRVWGGENYFWVHRSQPFTIRRADGNNDGITPPYNPSDPVHLAYSVLNVENGTRELIMPSNGRQVPFRQVDIGGGRVQNFTYNFQN
ncbi:DUF1036 domain-containing protein [Thermoleptolyngbya oregonensis NK1-22]|uniref:DUF1036 domain-containing protein n=1 Tax=Thermoleptolyngbya oregonensis NK1-22 TaxID=2547457 RepID=A0AA96Y5P8_9CYAN|nr:DUF1036 domain-containing protein [Thermoleptolyngbya oregonensis NK1-22]